MRYFWRFWTILISQKIGVYSNHNPNIMVVRPAALGPYGKLAIKQILPHKKKYRRCKTNQNGTKQHPQKTEKWGRDKTLEKNIVI